VAAGLAALGLGLLGGTALGSPDTALPWSVMGAGGNSSSSTNFRLGSTPGQSAPIGESSSTNFRLGAGYWYGAALPDQDGDGVADASDNCASVSNTNQANQDGDLLGDACESGACVTTPNWWDSPPTDPDCDGFTTADETRLGTNPNDPCADTSAVNDEDPDDKWPADFSDNQFVNTLDLVVYATSLNTTLGHPQFVARADLNGNDAINTLDLVPYVFMLNRSCVPPP
jgi:hypothetical protein